MSRVLRDKGLEFVRLKSLKKWPVQGEKNKSTLEESFTQ